MDAESLLQAVNEVGRRPGGAVPRGSGATSRRARTRTFVAGALALSVLLLAGCGSSSKSEPGDEAFIASANAACETATAEAEKVVKPSGLADVPRYVAQLDPIAQKLLSSLTALTPPAAKQAPYAKMLGYWRQEMSSAQARSKLAKAGDAQREKSLNDEAHQFDLQFDAAATEVGLQACARDI